MNMTRYFNMILPLFVGALLLLPSVALASFPDFGPFEQQTRYLEAGFGVAENFFKQASGQTGNQKTLQYLCLTAALVGAAMVVFRKKNQAMGVLIPWIVLVFIMLAGPFGSSLVFVKAYNNQTQGGGQLSGLMPNGLTDSSQKGFMPQVVSIHVMSTLHRLFYDYFDKKNVANVLDYIGARQSIMSNQNFAAEPAILSAAHNALQCNVDPSQGPTTIPTTNVADDNMMTLSSAISKIQAEAKSIGKNAVARPGIAVLPTTLGVFPNMESRLSYVQGLNSLVGTLGLDESLNIDSALAMRGGVSVQNTVQAVEAEIISRANNEKRELPASLSYYIASGMGNNPNPNSLAVSARSTDAHTDTVKSRCRSRNGSCPPTQYQVDELGKSDLYSMLIGAAGGMPVQYAEARMDNPPNGPVSFNMPQNCDQVVSGARGDVLNSATNNARGLDPNLIRMFNSGAPVTEAMVIPYTRVSRSSPNSQITRDFANAYLEFLKNSKSPKEATDAFLNTLLVAAGRGAANGQNAQAGMGVGSSNLAGGGTALINGFASGLVSIAKPILQLLSPFILAFSFVTVEMMKIIVDIALMGVIIVTPVAFMMGLLIPSNALGVMVLMTLCVLVLKMVPVTFTIADAILSIMYKLMAANEQGIAEMAKTNGWLDALLQGVTRIFLPSFEQTLLMFAAAGIYTGLVGLSLFILFKIGDPSSVAQLASIDGAAQRLSRSALAIGTAVAGAGVVGGIGARAAVKGQLGRKAAGEAAVDKLEGAQQRAAEEVSKLGDDASAMDKQKTFQESFAKEMGFTPGEDMFNEDGSFKGMSASEAFKEASGGLDMDEGNKGLVSNAALSALGEGGQVLSGAASSMLPGGGGALIQQATNANREGRVRGEARVSARGEGKSLFQADYESDVQNYRGQYASKLGSSAAFDGEEGAGGSGMMSSMMMGNAMSDGKSQAGQMASGLWTNLEMGKRDAEGNLVGMSAADYQVAHSLQAREAAAQLREASINNAEISGADISRIAQDTSRQTVGNLQAKAEASLTENPDGLTIDEFQSAAVLQERQAAANLREAAIGNRKITDEQIATAAEVSRLTTQAQYKQGNEQREFLNKMIRFEDAKEFYEKTDEGKARVKEVLRTKDGKAHLKSATEELENGRDGIADEIRQQNSDTRHTVKMEKLAKAAQAEFEAFDSSAAGVRLESGRAVLDRLNSRMVEAKKAGDLEAVEQLQSRIDTTSDAVGKLVQKRADSALHITEEYDKTKAQYDTFINKKVDDHIKSSARTNAVWNMLGKDIEAVASGKNAQFFTEAGDMKAMSMGVDMSSADAQVQLSSKLTAGREMRYTAGTQYQANRQAAQQFFQADYDGKYTNLKPDGTVKTDKKGREKEADLSLARHYQYSMIHESADGASDVKMGAKVNRRMSDQDWDAYNEAKAIQLEAQLRGKASYGRNVGYSQALRVALDEGVATGAKIHDRAVEVKLESQIIGPDPNSGKVMTFGQTLRHRATQDRYKKLNTELQKAMNNAGAAIAGGKGKDINGDSYVHDEPPGDWAAEMAKHFQRQGDDLDVAYQKQAALYGTFVNAGRLAKERGLTKEKAVSRTDYTDLAGVRRFNSTLNIQGIKAGLKLMGSEGQAAMKSLDAMVADMKSQGDDFLEVNGKFHHEVGVTAQEIMRNTKFEKDLLGKGQKELQEYARASGIDRESKMAALSGDKNYQLDHRTLKSSGSSSSTTAGGSRGSDA